MQTTLRNRSSAGPFFPYCASRGAIVTCLKLWKTSSWILSFVVCQQIARILLRFFNGIVPAHDNLASSNVLRQTSSCLRFRLNRKRQMQKQVTTGLPNMQALFSAYYTLLWTVQAIAAVTLSHECIRLRDGAIRVTRRSEAGKTAQISLLVFGSIILKYVG